MITRITAAAIVGFAVLPLFGLNAAYVGSAAAPQRPKARTEIATLSKLPSLGSNAEAHAVNEAGTIVVGHSFDRAGYLYAVKWTLQNGSWVISTLTWPGIAATAKGVDNHGNVVGYSANFPRRRILWPGGGGYRLLGCDSDEGVANAISADGHVVVGQDGAGATAGQDPDYCPETLPPLEAGAFASASSVNGDGNVIGGIAWVGEAGRPARWTGVPGQWQIEQLDTRPGAVHGANTSGDLAGHVTIPCVLEGGCLRGVIWHAAGGSSELGTLGGEQSWARDINSAGEVVGISTASNGTNTAFFWSPLRGMLQLPANRWGGANAVSDLRMDGTRLIVGTDSQANAVVWVVRTP